MADTVKVPVLGKVNKPTLFVAGLAGVAALGYAWYKNKKQTAAAAASTTTTPTVNPGYGYAYGYGAYEYEPYGYGYGPFGLGAYGGAGEYGYGYYGAGEPVNEEVPAAATTNAQWSEAAVTALGAAGWSSQDVLTALGLYLTGAPVSSTQQSIIQAAIAAEGYPPAPGASGYPPGINTGGTTGGGQGTTTSSSTYHTGNVYSYTTKHTAPVTSSDGGHTWSYIGAPPAPGKFPQNQTGYVHDSVTKQTVGVTTSNGGMTWIEQ